MPRSPFLFSAHDLPRRAGEMREYKIEITEHEPLGYEVVSIAKNEPIELDFRISSVSQGVLASGNVHSFATAECGRCLEPIEYEIDEDFTELFIYEAEKAHTKKQKREAEREELNDEDDLRYMEGEEIDLDGPIRDAIILNLPQNPLCNADCQGLCPDCGEKLENLPADHAHEKLDARWAALGDLAKKLEETGENKGK